MHTSFVPYRLAAAYLKQRLPSTDDLDVGIICGSGLAGLSNVVEDRIHIPYTDIPGYQDCTVAGHSGEVVYGTLSGTKVLCFRGRFHSYEGHSLHTTALPVRVMRCLGIRTVIITNASGALNPGYKQGDIICLSDHVALPQLTGSNPLMGPNDEEMGTRFPAMSHDLYPNANWRQMVSAAATQENVTGLRMEGVYCFVSGPMYESKAEAKFLRLSLYGDCVGMSTVPEIVAAHHCGMRVLAFSLITNAVTEDEAGEEAAHEDVLAAVEERAADMQSLVRGVVSKLRTDILPTLPKLKPISLKVPFTAKCAYWAEQKKLDMTMAMGAILAVGMGVGAALSRSR